MKLHKTTATFLLLLPLSVAAGVTSNQPSELFASNNHGEITVERAYERLIGEEQTELQETITDIMQKNHIEQGKFKNILGSYQMDSTKNVTGDNSEIFMTSPYQSVPFPKVVSLAHQLAKTLNQESIAIFVPNSQSVIGKITVKFVSKKMTLNELTSVLQTELPAAYSHTYSMELENEKSAFSDLKVSKILWLGSEITLQELQTIFTNEVIEAHHGNAYLIFRDKLDPVKL